VKWPWTCLRKGVNDTPILRDGSPENFSVFFFFKSKPTYQGPSPSTRRKGTFVQLGNDIQIGAGFGLSYRGITSGETISGIVSVQKGRTINVKLSKASKEYTISKEKFEKARQIFLGDFEVLVTALSKMASEGVSPLNAALLNRNVWVRLGAAKALGAIGADAKIAIPNLRRLLLDLPEIREAAAQAIKQIQTK
jgi:hypothetical protein